MFMTGLIPFSSYVFPAMAGIVLIAVEEENGTKTAMLVYVAVSVLAMFIVPDQEAKVLFVMLLGYYPMLKSRLERAPRPIAYLLKFLLFNGVIVAFYYVMLYVFGIPDMLEGWGRLREVYHRRRPRLGQLHPLYVRFSALPGAAHLPRLIPPKDPAQDHLTGLILPRAAGIFSR